MGEQVQLTGYERDALNAVIAAGGSMGGFEFLGHSDVGTLLKLVNSGLVYLHKGNVVVHKSTLDLAAELDTLRAENARLAAEVARLNDVITSMLNQFAKLGETVEESKEAE